MLYEGTGGTWSMPSGRIIIDRKPEFLGNMEAQEELPWKSEHLWERFTIGYHADNTV